VPDGPGRNPTEIGVTTAASGRLMPLAVEVVPSRTAAVQLAPFQATLSLPCKPRDGNRD
jgi:hypothetical protein